MKKIIYILIIVLIICLEFAYRFYQNKQTYIEMENLTTSISEIKPQTHTIKVHIIGEVNKPGIIELEENSRIADAIEIAEGITDLADLSKVNLAYKLEDGEKIYIPSIYDQEEKEIVTRGCWTRCSCEC